MHNREGGLLTFLTLKRGRGGNSLEGEGLFEKGGLIEDLQQCSFICCICRVFVCFCFLWKSLLKNL